MTNEEMNKINAIMKKVFIISTAIYAVFVFCIIYFCRTVLSPTQLVSIIIFTPMLIGVIVLLIYKAKHPPVLDESEDIAKVEIEEHTETEE